VRHSLAWTAGVALALSASGCTAVGFGIGLAIDSSMKDRTRSVVSHLPLGTSVTLHLRDGSHIRGWFRGLVEPDRASYLQRFRAWSDTSDAAQLIPAPGQHASLTSASGRVDGVFHGLSPAGVRIERDGSGVTTCVRFRKFEALVEDGGQSRASGLLEAVVQAGTVPTGTSVQVQEEVHPLSIADYAQDGPIHTVPWDDVVRVDAPTPARGKIIGVVVGFLFDLAILTLVALSSSGTPID